jgi:CHAT domain-containing protein
VRDLPRLWWVGRGKMGFAPLHAAGTHTPGSTENTVSHVLSSYATSLKALQFIKEKSTRFKRNIKHNMLLVSAPTTPGHDDLNVKDEVSAISKSLQAWATSLEYPSKLAVLSALTTCSLAHFACHGTADRVNPAKSALLLPQRNGAHLLRSIERLTVEDLDNTWSTQAQIVYLSACSTAENKAKYLVDEDIHLASSFQLLGFPHVICTLWGADDDASVEVARSFYKRLETCEESERAVAENLHLAILGYRNVGENFEQILKWAPFIHLGC